MDLAQYEAIKLVVAESHELIAHEVGPMTTFEDIFNEEELIRKRIGLELYIQGLFSALLSPYAINKFSEANLGLEENRANADGSTPYEHSQWKPLIHWSMQLLSHVIEAVPFSIHRCSFELDRRPDNEYCRMNHETNEYIGEAIAGIEDVTSRHIREYKEIREKLILGSAEWRQSQSLPSYVIKCDKWQESFNAHCDREIDRS